MTLVCIGIIVGLEISRARGIRLGLDVRDVVDGAAFTVASGFVGGHLIHILAYNPEKIQEEGLIILLQVWKGYSSMGGFVGAVLGFIAFFTWIRPRDRLLHADVLMFGFPLAQCFGRLGCFSVHDHIGEETGFFLGVTFKENQLYSGAPVSVRHDLGLYEAIVCLAVGILFFALARKARRAGFFIAIWCLVYAPARFLLDFMRKSDLPQRFNDVRYGGLTPAQYVTLGMVAVGLFLVFRIGVFRPSEGDEVLKAG